jgi:filamentous hemagglutinin
MDPKDHRRMTSTGSSAAAKAWRKKQQDLIDQGRIRDAVQMDIDEARRLFGGKYDKAIKEMEDYLASLGY